MNLDSSVPPGPPDNDGGPLFIPFDERAGAAAELPPNFGGHGHLPL